jgi:hypothetical protein
MATFTYESIKNRFKNPTVDGNLELLDDGAIIKIGADNDIQLSHSGTAGTLTILNGFTIDIVDDLVIDVDGGDIALKDAGTQFGGLSNSSGHLLLKDGTTTFLTGNGANATFAGTLATTGVLTADAGINVDNITIDGTEIDLSSGDLTLDSAGDIILDADGGDVFVKDAGTTYGSLTNSSGNLIIKSGTTTAATFSGANVTFAGTLASGAITSSGDVTAFSDMRLKTDIKTIDNALNRVCDLRGVFFTKDGEAGTGVIAQEVENILPEVVHSGVYKSVAYGNMVGVLIEAIKELRSQVKSLQESS